MIDDDAGETDLLDLDAQVPIGVERVPSGSRHAACLTAWAVGAPDRPGSPFVGVAPDAAVRHYYIPKPDHDVFTLALAIVQAIEDGADVILCASNVNGCSGPLLDDALEIATRLGRRGRGTAVVLPTSREMSSPPGALTASLSLGLGEPASDPRILCIAPSGRDGGWFLYRDRRGTMRPFSNRGPAVRWLAPGDDLADPFRAGRFSHAESSGAAAIAAGALLLVLATNPELDLGELTNVVTRTAVRVRADVEPSAGRVHLREIEPLVTDDDGHNAKHGYGRIHVTRACLAAADPICQTLAAMGEHAAASSWWALRSHDAYYSAELAFWVAQQMLGDFNLQHAVATICRHARLLAASENRASGHSPGAFVRQVALLTKSLHARARSAPPGVEAELAALSTSVLSCSRIPALYGPWLEQLLELGRDLWPVEPGMAVRAAS